MERHEFDFESDGFMMRLAAMFTSVMMLQIIAALVFMTAFTVVLVSAVEAVVPILANLFKKRQQLLNKFALRRKVGALK